MLGIPEETLENAYETVELNIKIKPDYPRCTILVPYPGTKVAEYAKEKALLAAGPDQIRGSSQHIGLSTKNEYLIKNNDIEKLINLHRFFQTAVIFPSLFPLIKKLVHLPSNIFFKAWWAIVYFFIYVGGERRSHKQTLRFALYNLKTFIGK